MVGACDEPAEEAMMHATARARLDSSYGLEGFSGNPFPRMLPEGAPIRHPQRVGDSELLGAEWRSRRASTVSRRGGVGNKHRLGRTTEFA